ncbi:Ig-like domain-containing protein [Methanobrevibacter curvatus]|uniref:Ig-like domain-containing protein n=1 Tax=Methanobrevibacter curvatus TaxID=49547 RepID=UPI00147168B8|nr:Ig-like domain-containing protein [Methanobrevibacter curvatus]
MNYTKTTEMLDTFAANGISIMVGVADQESGDFLTTYLSHYANHPAILGYCIGNEYNYHYSEWFGADETIGRINWMTKLNNTAKIIKNASPNRLVATAHGELPTNEDVIIYNSMPNLDLVMVNVYSGYSFWGKFTDWSASFSASAKPIVFSEFGRSSKSGSGENTSQQQLEWTESLLNEISAHLNTNSAGSFIFELVDESWKGSNEFNSNIGSEGSLGIFTNGSGTPQQEAKPVASKVAELWSGNLSNNIILSQVNTSNILSLSTLNTVVNSPVTFSAVLNTTYGVLPGRNIKFYLNGTLIGQSTTNSAGVATFKHTFTSSGSFAIFASFDGDSSYGAINSSVKSVSVDKIVPSLSLSSNVGSVSVNSVVVFSAVLNSGSGVVSGKTVKFYVNGSLVGSNVTNSQGLAVFSRNFNSVGSFSVVVSFDGDSLYSAKDSSSKSIVINAAPVPSSLTINSNNVSGIKGALAIVDTIYLNSGIFKGINNTNIIINKNVTIIGKPNAIIDCENISYAFSVSYDGSLTLINITICNSFSSSVVNSRNLTVINCKFLNNHDSDRGGAIYNYRYATVINSSFDNNSAYYGGGAIYNNNFDSSNLIVVGSNFTNNRAEIIPPVYDDYGGGAVYNYKGNTTIKNSNFFNNIAEVNGGAINSSYGKLTIENSSFVGNVANGNGQYIAQDGGGAIYNYQYSNLSVSNSTFKSNRANNNSGGAIVSSGNISVNECIFEKNVAKSRGGAIEYARNNATISNSKFVNNSLNSGYNYGSAIYSSNDGYMVINNSTFEGKGELEVIISGYGDHLVIKNSSKVKISTTISLNSNLASVAANSVVVFSAVLNSSSGAVSGKAVIFYINGSWVGSNLTNSQGLAVFSRNFSSVGSFGVVASFDGDDLYFAKNSSVKLVSVGKIVPSLSLSSNVGSVSVNSVVVFSAVLNSGSGVVSGKAVRFYVNGSLVGSNTTNSQGLAIFSRNFTSVGSFGVVASFDGDSLYSAKNSSVKSVSVGKIVPSLSLSSNVGSVSVNSVVVFSAVLNSGSGVVSGKTVKFYVNGSLVGSNITNSQGLAVFSRSFSSVGSFGVVASFDGDSLYSAKNSSVKSVSVGKIVPSLSLSSNVGNINVNSMVALSAILYSSSSVGSGKTIKFYVNGSLVGSNVTNSQGLAVFSRNFTVIGNFNVFASFDGDNLYSAKNSSSKSIVVNPFNPAPSSLTISSNNVSGIKGALAIVNTIYLNSGTFKGINNTNIIINKNVTIIGKPNAIIDCENRSYAFYVSSGSLTLINITICNSYSSSILNYGNLTVINCKFVNNHDSSDGGAITNYRYATVINSSFNNNSAYYRGGAIYNYNYNSGNLIVVGSNFTSNRAEILPPVGDEYGGGAVYNYVGNTTIKNSNFFNNIAGVNGGAVNSYDGKLTVENSSFIGNVANGNGYYIVQDGGGAIYNYQYSNLSVSNSTFKNNKANNNSGGAIVSSGNIKVNNCIFEKNLAKSRGGAIEYGNKNATISNSKFVNNSLISGNDYGSAIYSSNTGYMAIDNSTFEGKGELEDIIYGYSDSLYLRNSSKVKLPTKMTLKISKSSVKYGYLVKFTANLTNAENKAIKGQKVYFCRGNTKIGFNTTNSQGIAIFNYYSKTVGKFNVTSKFTGDSNYYSISSNKKTLTLAKDTPKLTFTIAKKRLKVKKKVKISITLKSSLKKAIKKQKVYLYSAGRKWFTATINSLGKATFYTKWRTKGAFTLYIKFKGNKYYKSAISKKIKVTIYR